MRLHYELYEAATTESGYSLIKTTTKTSFDHVVPLYARLNAKYMLESCSESACSSASEEVFTSTKIAEMTSSIGYAKASNLDADDYFGYSVSLSSDGNTLAVGAIGEGSNATGIDRDQDNSAPNAGAVYVFSRSGTIWTQQAYLKARRPDADDWFGYSVSLSRDGNTLAVGAYKEDSDVKVIDGNENNNSAADAGAVYVFSRSETTWTQQAYVKASNTDAGDHFGSSVSLSSDGNTLAVGARGEASKAKGIIDGDEDNNEASNAGAVYVFSRSETTWTKQAYVKARNTDASDEFGFRVSLSSDGNTLAVSAIFEGSNATGIDGDEEDNEATYAGAVYVFSRSETTWTQQAYVKASNTDARDHFGSSVSLSSDGNTLAVGAKHEDSNATGIIDTNQDDDTKSAAGAVYVFSRSDTIWAQQAYVKASNTDASDLFGYSVSLSRDGNTLAVGALKESSKVTGIGGDEDDNLNSAPDAGAVYVFSRSDTTWTQQAYVKARNTDADDHFGSSVSLSSDGNTLAVGAYKEDSDVKVIDGNENNNFAADAGAVYLY